MNVIAGSWLIASVWSVLITAIRSAIEAMWGSRLLTQVPLSPCCAKVTRGATTGNEVWCDVIEVTRWSVRTDGGSSVPSSAASPGL